MLFSWDSVKSETNLRKHGVRFEVAKWVFDDPLHITRQDRIEDEELRWQTIGMAGGVALLLVTHTLVRDGKRPRAHSHHFSATRNSTGKESL